MYILWIRHGFSCSNFLNVVDPFYIIYAPFEHDALLTNLGVQQSQEAGPMILEKILNHKKNLEVPPIIFSSVLSRAIQTADSIRKSLVSPTSNISKELPLVVIPYIEEIPWSLRISNSLSGLPYIDKQNKPRNIKKLKKDLKIPFNLIPNLNTYKKGGSLKHRVNLESFYGKALPEIEKYLKKEYDYKVHNNTVIMIVSHGETMNKATGFNYGNLGACLQNVVNNKVVSNELVFNGYSYNEDRNQFIPEDVSNCRTKRARNHWFK